MTTTIPHPGGGFRFTRGTRFFAGGVVAESGYDIVRARLARPVPLAAGVEGIRQYLVRLDRPVRALCGLELRAPRQYATQDDFAAFNDDYVDRLRRLDLVIDGMVPLTRANLAVADEGVHEQCVYAFMYTCPSAVGGQAFATSAHADVQKLGDGRIETVAEGDTSPHGLTVKVTFVVQQVEGQLRELGVSWADATQINAYAAHPIGPQIEGVILPAVGVAARHGVTWHFARPPVVGLDFELDIRAVRQEVVVDL